MRVGIDGSSLRGGGGVTHVVELLRHAEPARQGIGQVTVWAPRPTLERIEPRPWLRLVPQQELDGTLRERIRWQRARLAELAAAACDVLFVPGGVYSGAFRPFVAMSQNMLPFQLRERLRYGASWMLLRLTILHFVQQRTFRRADGVVYLTGFAARSIDAGRERAVIAHGVSDAFRRAPAAQRPLSDYSAERPFRILYASIIDVYKHQWHVAEAVLRLRAEGLPVALDLAGPSYAPARAKLDAVLARDRDGAINVIGEVPFAELPRVYHGADAFVFASSCENLPIILLEAMAAGLPIACSSAGPMPEVLGDAGVYFDPLDPGDIVRALREVVGDAALRARLAARAHERAARYDWTRCADQTFAFLARIAN